MGTESWTVVASLVAKDEITPALAAITANLDALQAKIDKVNVSMAKASGPAAGAAFTQTAATIKSSSETIASSMTTASTRSIEALEKLKVKLAGLQNAASLSPSNLALLTPEIESLTSRIASMQARMAAGAAVGASATKDAATADLAATRAKEALAASFAALAAKSDPAIAAAQRMAAAERTVTAAVAAGVATEVEGAAVLEGLAHRQSSSSGGGGHGGHGGSTALFRELTSSLPDEATSGRWNQFRGSLYRTANIAYQLNPALVSTIAPIAAVGAALAVGIIHAESFDRAIGVLSADLQATGRAGDISTGGLETLVKSLRNLPGVSLESAEAMIGSFSRVHSIGTASFQELGEATAGYARVTGEKVPEAAKQLTSAIEGGYASIRKLDEAYNFLTPSQAEEIRQLDAQGEKTKAASIAIQALSERFASLSTVGMTPMQTATHDLAVSWDNLMDSFGKSSIIAVGQEALANLATSAGYVITIFDRGAERSVADLNTMRSALLAQRAAAQSSNAPEGYKSQTVSELSAEIADLNEQLAKKNQDVKVGAGNPNADMVAKIKDAQDLADSMRGSDDQRLQITSAITTLTKAEAAATGDARKQLQDQVGLLQTKLSAMKEVGGENAVQGMRDQINDQIMHANGGKGAYGDQAREMELAFWTARLGEAQKGTAAYRQIDQQVYNLRAADYKADTAEAKKSQSEIYSDYSTTAREKITASQGNLVSEIKIAQEWVDYSKQMYGDDVSKYKAAISEKENLDNQYAKFKRDMMSDSIGLAGNIEPTETKKSKGPKSKDSLLADMFGLGDMSEAQTQLAQDMDTLSQTMNIKKQQMMLQFANAGGDASQLAGLASKLTAGGDISSDVGGSATQLQVVNDYAQAMEQNAQDIADANQKAAEATKAAWEQALSPITQGFDQSIKGVIQGTQTVGRAFLNMWQSFALQSMDNVVHNVVSKGADYLASSVGNIGGIASKAVGIVGGGGKDASTLAQTTALQTNTAALTRLATLMAPHSAAISANSTATVTNTAATTTHTGVTAVNAGATTMNTGATAVNTGSNLMNTGATTANTGGLMSHLAVMVGHEIAVVANSIATEFNSIVTLIQTSLGGFAGGGEPPVGRPSIVGENGPEIFMPQVAGRVVSNGEVRSMQMASSYGLADSAYSSPSSPPSNDNGSSGGGDTNASFHQHNYFNGNEPSADLVAQLKSHGKAGVRALARRLS